MKQLAKISLLFTVIFLVYTKESWSSNNSQKTEEKNKIEKTSKTEEIKDLKTEKSNIHVLDAITVTATRTPQLTFDVPGMPTVISDDIRSSRNIFPSQITDLIATAPGVDIIRGPSRNGMSPQIRGFDGDDIVVLIDGARQNFVQDAGPRISLDPGLIKKVEILKGSSSTLYGSGAMGGIMSFETKNAGDFLKPGQVLGGYIKSGYQSVNNEIMTSVASYGAKDKWDIFGNVIKRDNNSLKLSDGNRLKGTSDDIISGLLKLNYDINKYQTLKFSLQSYSDNSNVYQNPQTNPGGENSNIVNMSTKNDNFNLRYEYKPQNPLIDFYSQIYYSSTNLSFKSPVAISNDLPANSTLSMNLRTIGLDAGNIASIYKGEIFTHKLAFGVNMFEDYQDSSDPNGNNNTGSGGAVANYPKGSDQVAGSYLQDEINIAKLGVMPGSLLVIPGIRVDSFSSSAVNYNTQSGKAVTPKFGVTYKPTDWLMSFFSYSTAFRMPSLKERFSSGPGLTNGNYFIANPSLSVQRDKTYEGGLGLKFNDVISKQDNMEFKSSLFRSEITNYITQNPVSNQVNNNGINLTTFQSYNIPSATLQGFEITGKYSAGNLTLSANYTGVTGHDNTGQVFGSLSPKTVKAGATYLVPQIKTTFGFNSFMASRFTKNPETGNDGKAPGYMRNDIFAQYEPIKDTLTISAGIDNIFNVKYLSPNTLNYSPARNYKTMIMWKF